MNYTRFFGVESMSSVGRPTSQGKQIEPPFPYKDKLTLLYAAYLACLAIEESPRCRTLHRMIKNMCGTKKGLPLNDIVHFLRWLDVDYDKKQIEREKKKKNHLNQLSVLRKRGVIGTHTLEEWEYILYLYDYRCAYCYTKENITKDHIIPIARGGTNDEDNLQPLCMMCNVKKSTHVNQY